ncbi:hypothetical protein [Nonomuraea fuscirosea]|uniref:hypothetical protein n=1 Tax=Nonomuraea fuscirosea TaxID=1291556 RepID=UPI00341332FB
MMGREITAGHAFRYAEMLRGEAAVKGALSQLDQRSCGRIPAMRAIRSSSDGQT